MGGVFLHCIFAENCQSNDNLRVNIPLKRTKKKEKAVCIMSGEVKLEIIFLECMINSR